ncbi:unnamed protein product, partial [Discosporangium mesarthrocarpum]
SFPLVSLLPSLSASYAPPRTVLFLPGKNAFRAREETAVLYLLVGSSRLEKIMARRGHANSCARRTERPTSPGASESKELEPSEVDRTRPPCRFFLLGKCKFGSACTFSHNVQGRRPVCKFFEQNGTCRYGERCKFRHGSASDAPVGESTSTLATRSSSGEAGSEGGVCEGGGGEECGICLENIPASGKRYGLLNCDHVYCLECIRKWRNSKGLKGVCRGCPECRQMSFFVVPSKTHLKGEEKAKAIEAYKGRLSSRPCKYHRSDGSNTCPFGRRCFYAHLDADGVDVKDKLPPPNPLRRSCPYLQNVHG